MSNSSRKYNSPTTSPRSDTLLRLSATAFILLSSLSGCGSQNDLGANLQIGIQPGSVIIGPGPKASCVDLHSPDEERGASISGPLVSFNNFVLQWTSKDDLYISLIRVKFEGSGIANGSQTIEINADEMGLLLGRLGGYINGRLPKTPSGTPSGYTIIQSLDPARYRAPNATTDSSGGVSLEPCSLAVGGIQLTNGTSTPSFTATVTIDVIGTGRVAEGADKGKEYFVRNSATGFAEYFSY